MSSKEKGQKYFQDEWLENPKFKPWLGKVKNDNTKFRCNVCQKPALELSTSGQSALTDHARGKKHIDVIEKRTSFFKNTKVKEVSKDVEISERGSSSKVATPGQQTLEDCVTGSDCTRSEIIWVLNSVMNGQSGRNNDNLDNVFAAMFPDSKIAQNFSLGRTKFGYSLNHGLGPYFKNLTVSDIQKAGVFSVSFDESLNSVTQSSEMDIYVRYFDNVDNEVKVRYLGSSFMGHASTKI